MFAIFEEADALDEGDRRGQYGPILDSFEDIASIWNGVLRRKLEKDIEGSDVAKCMIGLKLYRESFSHSRDNLIDICGYTKCLGVLMNEVEVGE